MRFSSLLIGFCLLGGAAAKAASTPPMAMPETWVPQDTFVLRAMPQLPPADARDQAHEAWSAYQVSGDTRWLGRALSGLKDAPEHQHRLIKARVLQAMHRFDEANALLSAMADEGHFDLEARLLLASIHLAQGKPADALKACSRGDNSQPTSLVLDFCLGLAESRQGQVKGAFQRLKKRLGEVAALPAVQQQWAYGILAELADQQGQPDALQWYARALVVDADNLYLRRVVADYLYRQGRWTALQQLTADGRDQPQLALWHRLASQALGQVSHEYQYGLQQKMVEAERRQDPLDASMLSRYALWVENQPEKALRYAQQNWVVQKTPEDARLLLAAATRAGEQAVVARVFQWVDAYSLYDSRLEVYRPSSSHQLGGV